MIRYCEHCKKATEQYRENDTPTAERLFIGICTFGLSEAIVRHWWRCSRCGERNDEHDALGKI